MIALALLMLFVGAMVFAAYRDLVSYTIPNFLSLFLLVLFPFFAFASGMSFGDVGVHFLTGGCVLLLGILAFAFNVLGGGDAKLLSAAALWFGWPNVLGYVLMAAFFGGGLAFFLLLARKATWPAKAYAMGWTARLLDKKQGVPYGVALALAAIMLLQQSRVFEIAISVSAR